MGLGACGRGAANFVLLLLPDFWLVAFHPDRDPGFLLAFASICTLANLDSAIAEICVTARRVTSGLPGAMEELLLSAAKFNCSCAFPSISASLSTALSL